ncbi:MAG: quinol:cytochrome C oxidoreductase, partial [Bacteroidetes bacterium QH_2_63_10]
YIRALQRSQNASPDDLPPDVQARLDVEGSADAPAQTGAE